MGHETSKVNYSGVIISALLCDISVISVVLFGCVALQMALLKN